MLIEYCSVYKPSEYTLRSAWEMFFNSDYASDKHFKTFESAQVKMKEFLLFAVRNQLEARENNSRILSYEYEVIDNDCYATLLISANTEHNEPKYITNKSTVVIDGVEYAHYKQEVETIIKADEVRFVVNIDKISINLEE